MSGLANAAIASFLVEAICKYILGDFAGLSLCAGAGGSAGSLGGAAAAILVGLSMGTDPVAAVASGVALSGVGILPGFIAGYAIHFLLQPVRKHLPSGISTICGALIAAVASYGLAHFVDPGVTKVISLIGGSILAATEQSPLAMGFLLGGIMKIVCTSPLSSMALTAMLRLTGLPMGIACIACVGGSFTNGIMFRRLGLGDSTRVASVMLEPLTQADIITKNPLPIYSGNLLGGGLSGIGAAALGIVCDAPGTAAPIPGFLAPFAFNAPGKVALAIGIASVSGCLAGLIVSQIFLLLRKKTFRLMTSISLLPPVGKAA